MDEFDVLKFITCESCGAKLPESGKKDTIRIRGQKSENRRQRAEDRGQHVETKWEQYWLF